MQENKNLIFDNLENNKVYRTKIETMSKLEFLSGFSKLNCSEEIMKMHKNKH